MGINFGAMNCAATTPANTDAQPGAGIALDLTKGTILDLTKREPGLSHVIVGAGWDANNSVPAFDLDVSAFLLNANMKISSGSDVIFFNNKSSNGVTLLGDNTTGSGDGDDEQITVDLSQVSSNIVAIDFVINIFEATERRQTFGMVQNSYIRILNQDTGAEICRFRLKEDYGSSTAVVAGRLKRDGSEWQFEAIGEGKVVKSLNDIAALYS